MHPYLTTSLLYGAGWVCRLQPPCASRSLNKSLHLLLNHHRALDEVALVFGSDDEEAAFPGPFDNLDKDLRDKVESCGVDLDAMFNDYLMAIMNTASSGEQDPTTFLLDLLNEMADENEVDCTEKELSQMKTASAEYLECTGLQDLVGDENESSFPEELQEQVQDACGAEMNPMSGLVSEEAMQQCIDTILGDNPLGDMIRDIYHHPDKYCKCLSDYGNAVPECLMPIPDLAQDAKLPLSLLKKEACLLDIACEAMDGACKDELDTLDKCLPAVDASSSNDKECKQVMEQCQLSESLFMMAPPQLTQSQLPDSCVRVYQESNMDTNVIDRYTAFDNKCGIGGSIDVASVSKESNVESTSNNTLSANDIFKDTVTSTAVPLGSTVVLLTVAAIVGAIVLKKRRSTTEQPPVTEFEPVMIDDKDII